jgi:hypothetical protein
MTSQPIPATESALRSLSSVSLSSVRLLVVYRNGAKSCDFLEENTRLTGSAHIDERDFVFALCSPYRNAILRGAATGRQRSLYDN